MKKYYLFWLKSSRGTNTKTVICLNTTIKSEIQIKLEEWCSRFGAWEASENVCSYGFKQIKLPSFKECQQKLKKIVEQRSIINEKYQLINAMYCCRLYQIQNTNAKRQSNC